ncbi:MAG TPA: ABC transporter permease [Methylomirabilota bacterium]|nr:ABC transporter permease [Methylomirabilota bacterium]
MGPIRYIFTELWRTLSRHRTLCLVSVLSMSSILLILLLFMMVLTGVDSYTEQLESREEISIFLNEGLSRPDVDVLAGRLRLMAGVDSIRYVSKDEAWEQFRADVGDEALLQAVGENPLPASFVVRPKPGYRTAEGVRSIARQAETLPHVEDVRYAGEWVLRAEQVTRTLHQIGAVLGLIILIGVLFVVGATTRLAIQARLESLHVIRTLGGGFLFTEAPYLAEGFVLATISSGITILLARAIHDSLAEGLFHLPMPTTDVLLGFAAVSGLLGLLGSWIAVATLPRKWLL